MSDETAQIVYVGPAGAGFGFRMSGIDVVECDEPSDMLKRIKAFKDQYSIVFVDEGLAQPVLAEIELLNEEPIPAIVLLPNPTRPINLTQEKMNNLVIKAVGSDIFS